MTPTEMTSTEMIPTEASSTDTKTADPDRLLDLLVVGAGPTGIAIGAEARKHDLDVLLLDRGPLTASLQDYPTYMTFFTTRDLLEIAGIPFAIPEDKPNRRQALVYYRSVVDIHDIPVSQHEDVVDVIREEADRFRVETRRRDGSGDRVAAVRWARAVALSTGYFGNPRRLDVPGVDLPWVHYRYKEPYRHWGQRVVIVGGGNSAAEAALELWRNEVDVTLVHRRDRIKKTVKYWVKPDLENRIAEGSIAARFESVVRRFVPEGVEIEHVPSGETELLAADAAYILIGYHPDVAFARRCGVEIDPESLEPTFDPDTCESNVPGLYVAGTLQAGKYTGQIFIENTRDHGEKIVGHLLRRWGRNAPRARVLESAEQG